MGAGDFVDLEGGWCGYEMFGVEFPGGWGFVPVCGGVVFWENEGGVFGFRMSSVR